MVPGAPSFARLAAPGVSFPTVPLYLHLLNLMPGVEESVTAVRDAVRASPDLEAELLALLREVNWRPHLPAAVAVALGHGTPAVFDAVWAAFDRSWVAPQLAVAASLADADFESRARVYLEVPPGLERLRESTSGLAAVGKHIAALVALCRHRQPVPAWLGDVLARPTIQEALAADALWDRGGDIAERWRSGLTSLL